MKNTSIKVGIFTLILVTLTLVVLSDGAFSTTIEISPSTQHVLPGEDFSIDITVNPTQLIRSFQFSLVFNASLLQANSVTNVGQIFTDAGYDVFSDDGTVDNSAGSITFAYAAILGEGNVDSSGIAATISFSAKQNGTSLLQLYEVKVLNNTDIPITLQNGNVTIGNTTNPPINNPPVVPSIPSGPITGFTNFSYNFSTSTVDPEENQIYYLFDWGNNNTTSWKGPYSSGATCSISHSWNKTGTYVIKTKAKDINDEESNWSQALTIKIEKPNTPENNQTQNEIPHPDFSLSLNQKTSTVQFTDLSTDPDGNISQWHWDFGDVNTSSEQNPTHKYIADQTYTITLTIWDDQGAINTTSKQITIPKATGQADNGNETPGLGLFIIFIAITFFVVLKKYKN